MYVPSLELVGIRSRAVLFDSDHQLQPTFSRLFLLQLQTLIPAFDDFLSGLRFTFKGSKFSTLTLHCEFDTEKRKDLFQLRFKTPTLALCQGFFTFCMYTQYNIRMRMFGD